MTAHAIVWTDSQGGRATLEHVNGVQATLRSTRSFPPGAPVRGTLALDGVELQFTLKVASSRRIDEGNWELRGRLLSATAELIAAFARAAADPNRNA